MSVGPAPIKITDNSKKRNGPIGATTKIVDNSKK